jgi:hypothetical protein
MRQPVLLVDFCVYKPPEELKVNYLEVQDASKQWQVRARTYIRTTTQHLGIQRGL